MNSTMRDGSQSPEPPTQSKRPRREAASASPVSPRQQPGTKLGGRSRPATLLLMFEPVVPLPSDADRLTTGSEGPEAITDPESRSLGLLHYDAATKEYDHPELHDCRVRCVFDGPESRGILYRAKRMQSRLDRVLRTNRARYTGVFKARMLALESSGRFNALDMQVLRGHLANLQSSAECSSVGPAFLMPSGSLSKHAADDALLSGSGERPGAAGLPAFDVEVLLALAAFKTRFALPKAFVESTEFQDLARALFSASHRQGLRACPVPKTLEQYQAAVESAHKSIKERVCQAIQTSDSLYSSRTIAGYSSRNRSGNGNGNGTADGNNTEISMKSAVLSVIIHGRKLIHQTDRLLLRLFVSHQRQTHPLCWLLVDSRKPIEALAQQVTQAIKQFLDAVSSQDKTSASVISVVSAGLWPGIAELRSLVSQRLGCPWHMPCMSHTVDMLAFGLLRQGSGGMAKLETGQAGFADSLGVVHECSMSLVRVAQEIADHPGAHALWTEHKHRPICLPGPRQSWTSYSALFQQMVSVDYDLLLQLRLLVVTDDSASSGRHFDCLLDRNHAPMLLALVQLLALLDCAYKVTTRPDCSLSDLSIVLARLEATLDSLASGHHEASTDDMQLAARYVLDMLRSQLSPEPMLLPMVLAHSLSLYPRQMAQSSLAPPLTSRKLLTLGHRIWTLLTPEKGFSMPEMYTRWETFGTELRRAANQEDLEELPASFSTSRIYDLIGLPLSNRSYHPFSAISCVLHDSPISAAAAGLARQPVPSDAEWEARLCDPDQLKELEVLAANEMQRQRASSEAHSSQPAGPISIWQHQCGILEGRVDCEGGSRGDSQSPADIPTPDLAPIPEDTTRLVSEREKCSDQTSAVGRVAAAAAAAAATILAASSNAASTDDARAPLSSPSLLLCYFDRNALSTLL